MNDLMTQYKNRCVQYYKRKPLLCVSLLITIFFVVFTVSFGLYTKHIIPSNVAPTANYPFEVHNFLNPLAKWDSRFYLSIAKYGYVESVHTAFFPLYPMLSGIAAYFLGSYIYGAVLISWVSLGAALYFYLKIMERLFKLKKAEEYVLAAVLFLFFPTAVFTVGVYTESLFAALALGAIYFALRKQTVHAAVLASLACVTRLNGLFLLLFIMLILWEQKYSLKRLVLFGVTSLIPLGMYMGFLWNKFDNPLQFLIAEKAWNRFGGSYITTLKDTVTIVSVAGFLLLCLALWYFIRKRRWSFVVYIGLYLITPIVSGNFDGFSRYILMAFPVHWMVFEMLRKRKVLSSPTLAIYAALWSYYLIQFVGGYTGG